MDERRDTVRSFKDAAEGAFALVGHLQSEVEAHGVRATTFWKAWTADPSADPAAVLESFGRVTAVYDQLGELIGAQRDALGELPVRIA